MLRIGVTGGIACGKSLASSVLLDVGLDVCDADDLAHQAMRKGEPAYERVVHAFGKNVLTRDGEIDRRVLGERVFSDPEERAMLNALVHPLVIQKWNEWLLEKESVAPAAVVVVPLLFEIGVDNDWDCIICIAAPESSQKEWLRNRNLKNGEAGKRIRAQMSLRQKMARADYVVFNGGTKGVLREQMIKILDRILEK